MNIWVLGNSHLAKTIKRVSILRGFQVRLSGVSLMFCAQDVLDHSQLDDARSWFGGGLLLRAGPPLIPLVLVSQVSPGTTRKWARGYEQVYYQVDTIIMKNALQRAYAPEQIIVGCVDPDEPLPLAYQEYLAAFECPILQMSYESAELAKCAINYFLAAQIRTANELKHVADRVGAEYDQVARALAGDARIGSHAYLRPGTPNQHLDRDVSTILELLGAVG